MKQTLSKFLLCSALLLSASTLPYLTCSASAESTSSTVLSQGSTGTQVSLLQTNLKVLGYFKYDFATGYYGSMTSQAIVDFQQAYSLPTTGITDLKTQTAITNALIKKKIVADSFDYLRTPYVWGGTNPGVGFDCSGFIYYMFSTHGVSMNRTSSAELFQMGTTVSRSKLQPGDLVFFSINTPGVVDHVGIYVGGGQFISATRSAGIAVQTLDNNSYWTPRYLGAKRVY
jgi:cell wall-associated NlpC family hydrolase